MKTKLITYEHACNGLSLFVIPETDTERMLLRGLWKHGELKVCNGIADNSGQGFCVRWYLKDPETKKAEEYDGRVDNRSSSSQGDQIKKPHRD